MTKRIAAIAILLLFLPALSSAAHTPSRSATIRAVGDIMVHAPQLQAHRLKDGSYDFAPALVLIKDSLASADYTIGNLEGTVGKIKGESHQGFPTFNAPAALLDALQDAGVDMLSLANNHMLDMGIPGVNATLDSLDERSLAHVGANRDQAGRNAPVTADIGGIRFGFLAYTEHTNGMERFVDADALPYAVHILTKSNVPADIAALRDAGAEFIVAMLHWGEEYRDRPEPDTERIAQKLADFGVDAILGSHPHQVQPIRYVKRKDGGQTLVAYSMGNFLATMVNRFADGGLILQFTVRDTPGGGLEIADIGYVPIYLWKGANRNGGNVMRPIPAAKYWRTPVRGMSKAVHIKMKQSLRDTRNAVTANSAALMEE